MQRWEYARVHILDTGTNVYGVVVYSKNRYERLVDVDSWLDALDLLGQRGWIAGEDVNYKVGSLQPWFLEAVGGSVSYGTNPNSQPIWYNLTRHFLRRLIEQPVDGIEERPNSPVAQP